jgi:hypothetical protein
MRLPEAVYDPVLEGLGLGTGMSTRAGADPPGEPPDGRCQRRSFRRRIDAAVQFRRHGALNRAPQTCTLVDLSRDGVCVLMDAVVAPGEKFVLYLPRAGAAAGVSDGPGAAGCRAGDGSNDVSNILPLLCAARSSRLKTHGKFRTGAEFTDPADAEAEHAAFGQSAGGLTPRESAGASWMRAGAEPVPGISNGARGAQSRRTDRHESGGMATMHRYGADGRHGEPETVHVRDYSEAGVAILRAQPLKAGDEFVVRVPREGEPPITRLCRVVNVAVAAGRYRIGAEFIPFPGPRGRGLVARLVEWIA